MTRGLDIRWKRCAAVGVVLAALTAAPAAHAQAPPPPCSTPQIVDATTGPDEGHHPETNVARAWFSEAAGHLQAVIEVVAGTPGPAHTDEPGAGYVFLFRVGEQTWYVRAIIGLDGTPTFDYGTYTTPPTFTQAGATTGAVLPSVLGRGSVVVDVPAATGAVEGTLLAKPFVLTYDGATGGVPHWVDHAPGGIHPTDTARGRDFIVGRCDGVDVTAPARLVGGGRATISGKLVPAREGVQVTITRQAFRTLESTVTSRADGTFSLAVPVHETTRVTAAAELDGLTLTSQTRTIRVRSTVRLTGVRKLRGGVVRIAGVTKPALPGRLLLLRTTAITPRATKTSFRGGAFAFKVKNLRPGRYQVVYIPKSNRAERSTSNAVRVR